MGLEMVPVKPCIPYFPNLQVLCNLRVSFLSRAEKKLPVCTSRQSETQRLNPQVMKIKFQSWDSSKRVRENPPHAEMFTKVHLFSLAFTFAFGCLLKIHSFSFLGDFFQD